MRNPAFTRWVLGNVAAFAGRYWLMVSLGAFFAVTEGVFVSVLVAAAMLGTGFIGAPVGGVLADRHSPTDVIRFAGAAEVAVHLALAATLLFSAPLAFSILCLAAIGFFHNVAGPAAGIFRHAVLSDEQLERGMGILNVAAVGGVVVGSLGSAFISTGGVYVAVAAGAVGYVVQAFSTAGVAAPHGHASISAVDSVSKKANGFADLLFGWRETYRNRFVFLALIPTTLATLLPVFALQAAKISSLDLSGLAISSITTLIGVVTMVSSVAAALSAYVFSRLVKRQHVIIWLLASLLVNLVACVFWFSTSFFYVLLAMTLFNAVTGTVIDAAADLVIHTAAPLHIRGRAYGLFVSMRSFGQLAPTALVGYLVGIYGFNFLFVPAAFIAVVFVFLVVKFRALESPYVSAVSEQNSATQIAA